MRSGPLLAQVAAWVLLLPAAPRAQTALQIQPVVRPGDSAGGVSVKADSPFAIGTLNDQGQLVLNAETAAGGQLLLQYADGHLIPIVAAGGDGPDGKWPQDVGFYLPVSMNQHGDVVFGAAMTAGNNSVVETFLWDYQLRQINPVVLPGIRGGDNLRLSDGGGPIPVLNNNRDIAFSAPVKGAAGTVLGYGVFFLGRDGRLQPVALPGQPLPDGGKIQHAYLPSLNDAGVVAFLVNREGDPAASYAPSAAYLWEKGRVTPLPVDRLEAPPGTLLLGFTGVWLNNKNDNVLLAAHLHTLAGHFYGLYLLGDGAPISVAVLGQDMPGGGKLLTLQPNGVSAANEAGQHAFLATLENGTTAAYLMNPDGKVSLVLKNGMSTNLGKITNVGQGTGASQGVGLNSQGQMALPLQVGGGRDMVVLLTPPPP